MRRLEDREDIFGGARKSRKQADRGTDGTVSERGVARDLPTGRAGRLPGRGRIGRRAGDRRRPKFPQTECRCLPVVGCDGVAQAGRVTAAGDPTLVPRPSRRPGCAGLSGTAEGDMVIGQSGKTIIGKWFERVSRFVVLLPVGARDATTVCGRSSTSWPGCPKSGAAHSRGSVARRWPSTAP